MATDRVLYRGLVTRANSYLVELTSVISENNKSGLVGDEKDLLNYAMFRVDVGKAMPDLLPEQQATICRMLDNIDQAMLCLEKDGFRRKYGDQ